MEYRYGQLNPPSSSGPAPAPTGGGYFAPTTQKPTLAGMSWSSMADRGAGMAGSRPSYVTGGSTAGSVAARMGAGRFSAANAGRLTDTPGYKQALLAKQLQDQKMAGMGVRPGAMPQMNAVAAARMQGQMGQSQSAMMSQRPPTSPAAGPIDPTDPRNAALAQYR